VRFNINNKVKVRLTNEGRAALRKNHDELYSFAKGTSIELPEYHAPVEDKEYHAPVEDKEGWSEWQLWALMREFGPYIGMGLDVPFETEIEIPEPSEMLALLLELYKYGYTTTHDHAKVREVLEKASPGITSE